METTQQILDHASQVMIGNYARLPIVMDRGEGSLLWDTDKKQYIDFFAGFGGAILGHCHPALVQAAHEQAMKLWHVGNTFHTQPQIQFSDRLNRTAFKGQSFFCHSGLEANEAAIKLARLRGQSASPKKWKMVSLHRSFHGRSLAMIAATGNPNVKVGFEPAVPGFIQVEPGDIDALSKACDDETAGIIIEPIQGEGGIYPHTVEYVLAVRKLCDDRGMTLIFDEVWTGCGRTGKWFGHQLYSINGQVIEPDIMTLGKAVGGGLPVGVMFAKPHMAALLTPGKHGCTLGGNPICMNVARTIFDVIEKEQLLGHAKALGERAMARLKNEKSITAKVAGIRGSGLFLGIELKDPPTKLVEKALEKGLVINLTAQKIIRLAPPINISQELFDKGLDVFVDVLKSL